MPISMVEATVSKAWKTYRPMEKVDIAIIGAGVVGLAIACELSRQTNKSITVLEKNTSYGLETSSRNSQVIHSGIYYPSAMLKTRLCIEGRQKLYNFCQKYQIGHDRRGKLVVACHADESASLHALWQQGCTNGIEVKPLSNHELQLLEPSIQAFEALWLPDSGIIDVHQLMQKLYQLSRASDVIFNFHSELLGLEYCGKDYILTTNRDKFKADTVINSAGLASDAVCTLLGLDIDQCSYRIYPCKGEYYTLKRSMPVNHLIYPLPENSGTLGIHITPDISGRLRLGPNAYEVGNINYAIDDRYQESFYLAVHSFLPDLQWDDIAPDFAGIRPRLQRLSEPLRDFIINEESDKGFPQFINLIGIESPGLTSSLAIASYIKDLIN
jgi:L-2-hydroxyglutarate oxidase LhgO